MIDPGIFDLAHSKGIASLQDMNGDGNINNQDLTLALANKAKLAGATTETKPVAK